MSSNSYGILFKITTFGESHGEALGVVIDGMPSNVQISLEELKARLKKRAPGQSKGTTTRKESDDPIILSGIFEGKTLGTPICVIIKNENQRSSDYDSLKSNYRPGHADRTYEMKYGIRDHRGGGRSSGRETVARVIAGYFASLIVPQLLLKSTVVTLGKYKNLKNVTHELNDELREYLSQIQKEGDSVGGNLTIEITNCPPKLGEPVFDKLKAELAKALMSIGGVVSFSYGMGSHITEVTGLSISDDHSNFGGIEGGISNGDPIQLHIGVKPVSTVGEKAKSGRHDPSVIPRIIPVIESMIEIVIADFYLRQKAYEI